MSMSPLYGSLSALGATWRKLVASGSTLLDGLVSYWPLNEVSGVRYDAVGTNHLTDNNTVGAVLRGPEGTVANFVAANSEDLSNASAVVPGSAAYSVVAWVNTNTASNQNIWDMSAGNQMRATIRTFGVAEFVHAGYSASQAITYNVWSMVACWWDGTKMYVSVNNATPAEAAVTDAGTASAMRIGGNYGSWYMNGKVATPAVWSRTLTSDERTALFASGNGLRYADLPAGLLTDLVSWWELDEVSGVRYDSHGSNDLTDNNTVGSANSGPRGTVARFVKANSEYLRSDAFSQDLSAGWTASTWVRESSLPSGDWVNAWLLERNHTWGVTATIEIKRVVVSNQVYYACAVGDGTTQIDVHGYGVGLLPYSDVLNKWVRVVVQFDPNHLPANLRMWVNGVERFGHNWNVLPGPLYNGNPQSIQLNYTVQGGTAQIDGDIGATGIWSRILSEAEIEEVGDKQYDDLSAELKAGLLAWYDLDEQSGTRADRTGAHDLTDYNTVGSVINAGAAMDGAAAKLTQGDGDWLQKSDFVAPDEYTISMWVNGGTGGSPWLTAVTTWASAVQFAIYAGTANVVYHLIGDVSGNYTYAQAYIGNTAPEFTTAGWFHVVAWLGSDGIPHLSLNGGDEYIGAAAPPDALYRTPVQLRIGASAVGAVTASVDEVAIWDRVLTADERAELFRAGAGKFYPFPLA